MALVELRDVHKTFAPTKRGGAPIEAVRGVSLDVEAGEIHAIVGYSGAGKSTLVRLVNALEQPTSGTVTVDGTRLDQLGERDLRRVRQGIGMVFQQFNLMRSRTVWGNLEFPLKLAGVDPAERQRRISELLHFVGLADKAHAHPEQLSGGQKQRVGIARALATNPSILLADESTSALDPDTTREVLGLLRKVNEELGITIIVITHEMDVVRTLAHKVSVMETGRVVESGPVIDIFARPREAVTRRFVSTLVDEVPQGAELEALRRQFEGRLIVVDVEGHTSQSDVFTALATRGLSVEVVQGGVNRVGPAVFGHVTLAVRGEGVDEVVAEVGRLEGVEVLA
ncbi:ATP-binding cassette domain-containing protein [Aeromicrobium sp. 636]|uniref:Methionine ABC transporter ATP-binding protein n=1 Tax=Aeromicrobium senzhongii TaxID=2663859 RepID=A0A8I0EUK2_9ACTN|nr:MULTISPECIES: methionine ABC transporter ATP-binding protein [Aeromicrobium]MBC9225814.1 methionine ABC transporter ATP-binding protein [Aeromicrobium senzhongii]MCQ3997923.1 ATP-binding cassette domain-containing protein [Aeromicrobium sp. 636]MTB87851.1 ATP-binding cassette domain-containing protein [Aeromicrobium senzhongii]QNL95129.1 methionine ABC transporter ATP-binding protein [Aeromicrobium senzhongii]